MGMPYNFKPFICVLKPCSPFIPRLKNRPDILYRNIPVYLALSDQAAIFIKVFFHDLRAAADVLRGAVGQGVLPADLAPESYLSGASTPISINSGYRSKIYPSLWKNTFFPAFLIISINSLYKGLNSFLH